MSIKIYLFAWLIALDSMISAVAAPCKLHGVCSYCRDGLRITNKIFNNFPSVFFFFKNRRNCLGTYERWELSNTFEIWNVRFENVTETITLWPKQQRPTHGALIERGINTTVKPLTDYYFQQRIIKMIILLLALVYTWRKEPIEKSFTDGIQRFASIDSKIGRRDD